MTGGEVARWYTDTESQKPPPVGRSFCLRPGAKWFRGVSYTGSITVVTVWGIAISIVARIEATIPTVPAVKAAAAKPAAVKTSAAETAAAGLGSTNADRGGERDSHDG